MEISKGGLPWQVNRDPAGHSPNPVCDSKSRLSAREWEVLKWLAMGLSYKQIADRLGITLNTVNNHLRNIREKLGAHSSIEAINMAQPWPPLDGSGHAAENTAIGRPKK